MSCGSWSGLSMPGDCGEKQPMETLESFLSCDASTVASASSPLSPGRREETPADAGALTFADAYLLGGLIGRGGYGTVHTASLTARGQTRPFAPDAAIVAVKVVKALPESDEQGLQLKQLREVRVWKVVGNSKHCIRLYEAFVEQHIMHLVMEKAGCNLLDMLTEHRMTSEKRAAYIFGQMLAGIAHCHSVNVVHRDIKPENFMVDGDSENCVVKLADFGLSIVYEGKLLRGHFGSAPYLCPEMLLHQGHDMVSDVWAFGATAYRLLYGEWLYMPCAPITPEAMKDAIRAGSPLPRFTHNARSKTSTRAAVGDLGCWLRQLVTRSRISRPSASDAQILLQECLGR